MNFQTMTNQKLNYRIPYPNLLHIEENQIYNPPAKKHKEIEQEEESDMRFCDFDLKDNKALFSEPHSGNRKLWQ